jgi:hypothetical protein
MTGELRVAHGVHASMNTTQPIGFGSPMNVAVREAELSQLPIGDDAVLPRRELGEASV